MKSEPFPSHSTQQASQSPHSWKASFPHIERAKLHQIKLKDYALRFLFGGGVSVVAALLGHWVTPRFGGLFTAFPAILLASLTLIGKKEGREPSAEDAQGGVVGALALVGTAAFLAVTLPILAGVVSLLAALVLWLLLGLGLYLLGVKVGWLRTSLGEDRPKPEPSSSNQNK